MPFWNKNKVPKWITELKSASWLRDWILHLRDVYGEEQFKHHEPIIIQGDYRSQLQKSENAYLTAIATDMCSAARIPIKNISVEVYTEDNVSDILTPMGIPHSTDASSGTAGCFHAIDEFGTAHIAIESHQMDDHISLAGTLAHELAHVFLHLKRPSPEHIWPEEDEEPITDLAAIILGFGVYICNSCERFRKFTDGQLAGWSSSRSGYLSLEECTYAQAFVNVLNMQNFKSYKKHLSANPREFISDAIPVLQNLRTPGSSGADGA